MWSRRVTVATGFRERLIGLRHAGPDAAMLLEARSVHGFGMTRPVLVVWLDHRLTVVGVETLRPNRLLGSHRARYALEMPIGAVPPSLGSRLEIGVV